jgi:nucleotide-binding universal stress UspA family protein
MLPKIETILYATDLGPGARYVFRHALALARQHQAKLIAVYGIEPLSSFGQRLVEQYISHDVTEEMHGKAQEKIKADLKERLESLCAQECNGDAACQRLVSAIRVADGYPARVILDTANECSADLIVMGAHSRTVIGEVMVGSTTRKVLHAASQPVLVIKISKRNKE